MPKKPKNSSFLTLQGLSLPQSLLLCNRSYIDIAWMWLYDPQIRKNLRPLLPNPAKEKPLFFHRFKNGFSIKKGGTLILAWKVFAKKVENTKLFLFFSSIFFLLHLIMKNLLLQSLQKIIKLFLYSSKVDYSEDKGVQYDVTDLRLNPTYIWWYTLSYICHPLLTTTVGPFFVLTFFNYKIYKWVVCCNSNVINIRCYIPTL